ncbi:MAG: 6-phosphofructokinase [Proteobacteria bacterium]|nr:6-phosphofructokinase [Pseudomonadota bacterium]
MNTLAVLTSGGDAPGMNAAIRAVVKVAAASGIEVIGYERGYDGLMDGLRRPLTVKTADVRPAPDIELIGRLGGTVLGSVRSPRFMTPQGRAQAGKQLADVDGLIVIGGNGSLAGAHALAGECNTRIVGIPASWRIRSTSCAATSRSSPTWRRPSTGRWPTRASGPASGPNTGNCCSMT